MVSFLVSEGGLEALTKIENDLKVHLKKIVTIEEEEEFYESFF